MPENKNLERRVENILITKTKFYIGVITFMIPVLGFFFKIQLDIALIKENHEAHMQAALEKIANLEAEEKEINAQLKTQNEAIIRLLQVHDMP